MSTGILHPGPELRPAKRRRLSPAGPLGPLSNGRLQSRNATAPRPRRSRSDALRADRPSRAPVLRKRRRSTPHTDAIPEQSRSSKRMRTAFEDVEMEDVSHATDHGTNPAPRRKKTLLRDVLRAEKVSRARWQNVVVQRAGPSSSSTDPMVGGVAQGVSDNATSATSEMGLRRASVESVTRLTGEEEVCEVIDASENSDPNANFGAGYTHSTQSGNAPVEPSVQAVLLEDGLCAVRIVRADGSTQSVIIQPPDVFEDGW